MARRAQHLRCSLCERSERADNKLDKEIKDMKIDSVQQAVKTELKIWADVAQKGIASKPITTKIVKEAVKNS